MIINSDIEYVYYQALVEKDSDLEHKFFDLDLAICRRLF